MLDKNTDQFNEVDAMGNPTGGHVNGVGLHIEWQKGPLGRGPDRLQPNGAFVETVIEAARQRIEFYETASGGKFSCYENRMALQHLIDALSWLELRTKDRERRQVEGTHVK